MKYLLLSFIFTTWFSNSQNLVPNPGFEEYSLCPTNYGPLTLSNWYRPLNHGGTADYFNICAPYSNVSIPLNHLGEQSPKEGNAYIGIFCYHPANPLREYIETKLTSPLMAGETYQISFFASAADTFDYAVNNLGAVLTDISLVGNNELGHINITPHINHSQIITDRVNWIEISGFYQAQGGEEYITIGNFYSDDQTEKLNFGTSNPAAYYFIDSVQVIITDESNCLNFLNPVYDFLHFESTEILIQNVSIIDISGKTINKKLIGSELYVGDLQEGVYIVKYYCGAVIKIMKFIKI